MGRMRLHPNRFSVTTVSTEWDQVRSVGKHSHEFFEILCLTEGHMNVQIRSREFHAGPGDLLIYYPGEEHDEFIQPGRFSLVCLRFDSVVLKRIVEFPHKTHVEPLVHLPWPERFQNLFAQMLLEQQWKDPWSEVMITLHLVQFTVLLRRVLRCLAEDAGSGPDERARRIGKAIDVVHSSLHFDLSLKDLASEAFMSESHFSHTFKEMVGISPRKYVTRAKVLRAQELLLSTDRSVKSIAMALGYDDPHHFSRVFRRSAGQSPSYFRKNRRK
jgi:AraC-like DNA-binding protein